ncbi:hypothetical protein ACWDYH_11590 [Nocardia goodfellowii]|uniref:Uncharacterized protein n=1 Tax=Nocardia goodfellowii TaxID=882446 RepID=A0ABS4QLN2_9NOCA|nr:hypothetical protein [Nocardia goodfellowii]MBP2192600.1 hypothetical protein [Nocardia goodfellowii]
MNSRIIRPLIVAGLVLTAGGFGGGVAAAAAPAPVSGSSSGSVEVCVPIPLGPVEFSICL